jgi:hypothetical protein
MTRLALFLFFGSLLIPAARANVEYKCVDQGIIIASNGDAVVTPCNAVFPETDIVSDRDKTDFRKLDILRGNFLTFTTPGQQNDALANDARENYYRIIGGLCERHPHAALPLLGEHALKGCQNR